MHNSCQLIKKYVTIDFAVYTVFTRCVVRLKQKEKKFNKLNVINCSQFHFIRENRRQRVRVTMAVSTIAVFVFILHLVALGNSQSLEILPSGETQTKAIGSSIILTCKPEVQDLKLVGEMQWLDPQNRTIESSSAYAGHSKPAMYTEIHQDNSLSLFFNSLQEDQAGKYTCKANYANTIVLNKSVTIETIVAITWINAPSNQYAILGEDFPLKCQVRARPSPSVDWIYNGELIKTNDHYIIEPHALRIKNIQEADSGIYTCRASVVTTGELQKLPIRVEVHTKPTIEEIATPVEIIEGDNADIKCKGSGKPPPKYTWVKSLTQQNLSIADRFSVNPDTGVLTITSVNRNDAGEYQCTASNAAGTATTNIMVDVIVKPKIMEFLNVTKPVEKEIEMTCKAFGRPPPVVTFRKHTLDKPYTMGAQLNDNRAVLTNKINDVNAETIGKLTIHNIARSDDGLYECIAQNPGGVAYKNGHLTIEFPPSFASMPNATIWSWDKRPVNLTCIAESIPNATIRWNVYGNQEVDKDPMIKQIGNGPISTLQIKPVDKRYYRPYKCVASNIHGTREHIIILNEAEKPGELMQVKMAEITATTIRFDMIPPVSHPDLPIKTITVEYKEQHEPWATAWNKTWSINSIYVIEGLKPQTQYDFRFAGSNEVGLGNWGAFYRESTPGKSFPNEPKPIVGTENGYEMSSYPNQYELSWIVPADNGEMIDFYEIRYCQLERISGEFQVQENTCHTTHVRSQGRTRHWLKDLHSDTFYRAEIRAHNAMGYSEPGSLMYKTNRGDHPVVHHRGPLLSSGAIIGIIVAIIFIIIVVIDIICCCAHQTGIIHYLRETSRRKPVDEEDSKLDRDEKEPLKEEKKIAPIIDSGLRKETSITFNGKSSVSRTGFVGKDSAV